MRMTSAPVLAVVCALCAAPLLAQMDIGAGSTLDLGTGTLDLGCVDLGIAGTMHLSQGGISGIRSVSIQSAGQLGADAGSLAWSGDWTDGGQFVAGSSTASSVDGCGTTSSTFHAGESFYGLSLQSAQGRDVRFATGLTTNVAASFTASGVAGQPLRIRSTIPGGAAILTLAPGATQSVFAVDVADSHASPPIAPGPASNYSSIKESDSDGWFESAAVAAIPALSTTGLILIAAGLALVALRQLASRN